MNHQEYRPETPDYRRLVRENLLLMLVYHAASWIVYITLINIDLKGMGVAASRVPWGMFYVALGMLSFMGIVFTVMYFKSGERKRAYLAATSVEVRGEGNAAAGVLYYRKIALRESIVCTLASGILWLIPATFYTVSVITKGYGFGYRSAGIHEKFFVGFIGFCEPFQNALVGLSVAMTVVFVFHYFGRLYSHRRWGKERIRR